MIEAPSDTSKADSAATAARIVIDNVSKSFRTVNIKGPPGKHSVLHDLSWSIPSGSVVGLLGVNGSGKSTLLRCILGLLRPDSGSITIDDHDVWNLPSETKARVGFVDQNPRLYPWMRGKYLLEYIGSFYPKWNDLLLAELAERWDVPLNKAYGTLSPGQQQKVAILSALGNEPELLVLDEPVSSLDPMARREFLKSLLEIAADGDRTVLFSTHITSDLERVASHVAVLHDGTIRWFDELDDLKDRVKRIRLRSQSQLPSDFHVDDAISVNVSDLTASVVVSRWSDQVQAELADRIDAQIEVEDLNLEEIFLELHGAG